MRVINVENTVFIDVDETLVMWNPKIRKNNKLVAIIDPYSKEQLYLAPHFGHIKVLKDRKMRGAHITVWSAAGFRWAEAVVRALNLIEYVDSVMTKPLMYIDDKKAKEIMGEHLYISYDSGYGK